MNRGAENSAAQDSSLSSVTFARLAGKESAQLDPISRTCFPSQFLCRLRLGNSRAPLGAESPRSANRKLT